MSGEVTIEPGTDGGWQPRAGQLPQGLGEAAILSDEEVVMAALQVEGMEGKEHACRGRTEVQSGVGGCGRGLESSSLFQQSAWARDVCRKSTALLHSIHGVFVASVP